MLEKIEKLRKAPVDVRERLVSLITIFVVGFITIIWFLFSIPSLLSNQSANPPTVSPVQSEPKTDSQTLIKAPFSE